MGELLPRTANDFKLTGKFPWIYVCVICSSIDDLSESSQLFGYQFEVARQHYMQMANMQMVLYSCIANNYLQIYSSIVCSSLGGQTAPFWGPVLRLLSNIRL